MAGTELIEAYKLLEVPLSLIREIKGASSLRRAIKLHTAKLKVLKSCWVRLAMIHHPDRGGKHSDFISLRKAWAIVKSKDFAKLLWEGEKSNKVALKVVNKSLSRPPRFSVFSYKEPQFLRNMQ